MKENSGLAESFLKFVGSIVLLATLAIVRGWALSKLWVWFIVPLGAPQIGIAMAIGVSGTIALFHPQPTKKSDDADWATSTMTSFCTVLVSVGFGWITKQFI